MPVAFCVSDASEAGITGDSVVNLRSIKFADWQRQDNKHNKLS
jgi:hypothetical protein